MILLNAVNQTKNKLLVALSVLLLAMNLAFTASAQHERYDEKHKINETMNNENKGRVIIEVGGMSCMSCVANVKRTIASLDGVDSVAVSLEGKNASISYDVQKVDIEKIKQAINKRGFKAREARKEDR